MKLKLGEALQLGRRIGGSKSTVGIYAQFYLPGSEVSADMCQQFQFAFKVDGTDLELDATETVLHLLFNTAIHFVEVAHPNEAVDGDARFSLTEGRRPELQAAGLKMEQSSFQSEEDGGIREQGVAVYLTGLLKTAAGGGKYLVIIGEVVATQSGKRGALAHAVAVAIRFGKEDVPHVAGGVCASRRAGRLLKVQLLLYDAGLILHMFK